MHTHTVQNDYGNGKIEKMNCKKCTQLNTRRVSNPLIRSPRALEADQAHQLFLPLNFNSTDTHIKEHIDKAVCVTSTLNVYSRMCVTSTYSRTLEMCVASIYTH